jgi:hypothetical protein
VLNASDNCDLFSLEVCHNGFFCGLRENLSYVSASTGFFDNCSAHTWSAECIDEILRYLGCERDGMLQVYWCLPGKDITDGLVPIDRDVHFAEMVRASKTHKTLNLFIDHTNFLRTLRADVIINERPNLPPVISPPKVSATSESATGEASSSTVEEARAKENDEFVSEVVQSDDSDSEFDCDIYDSDCNAEDGDDDLFADNVDTDVNDHNKKEMIEEHEDEQALEDEDLNLFEGEREKLKHKFRAFNPEVDMHNPVFKVGMVFSDVEEARKALASYTIRNRVKIKKTKNDRRRLEVVCDAGCPWLFKSSNHSRYGGFAIIAY